MVKKRVLIGCEFSGIITKAFRERGIEAYSCDELPTEGNPDWHIQDDVLNVIKYRLSLLIAHPPCTRLANSVWWYIVQNNLYNEVKQAADFFNKLWNAPIKKIVIENPIQNKEARKFIRKYDQIIQPYQFGHPEKKATCLWLKGLPILEPTNILKTSGKWSNQTPSGNNRLWISKDRCKDRSRTYTGIAQAIADQYIEYL